MFFNEPLRDAPLSWPTDHPKYPPLVYTQTKWYSWSLYRGTVEFSVVVMDWRWPGRLGSSWYPNWSTSVDWVQSNFTVVTRSSCTRSTDPVTGLDKRRVPWSFRHRKSPEPILLLKIQLNFKLILFTSRLRSSFYSLIISAPVSFLSSEDHFTLSTSCT